MRLKKGNTVNPKWAPPLGPTKKMAQVKGRECGECNMCCKLLDIPEFESPPNSWCPLCEPGGQGCTVWGGHPKACQQFECLWLNGYSTEEDRPDKSKVVIFSSRQRDIKMTQIIVDPAYPWAYRVPFVKVVIDLICEKNGLCALTCGPRKSLIGRDWVIKRFEERFPDWQRDGLGGIKGL